MALEEKNYDPALMAGANIGVSVDLTDITDNNGNEVIEIDGVTSAVNYVRASNSITGSPAALSAQGDDTNIGLQLSPLGTAVVLLGELGTTSTIQAGSATINAQRGIIQTGASIAAGSSTFYSFDFKNNKIWPTSIVQFSLVGLPTTGAPTLGPITLGSGSCTVRLADQFPFVPMAGSTKIHFVVFN